MKIAQLMTPDVKTCHPHDALERAVGLMWEHDIGVVAVVDAAGQLIAMITDRDACMAAYLQRRPLHDIPVSAAMTRHVVTCRSEDSDRVIAQLMAKHKIRRIPVVDDDHRPVGIISINDLAVAMARGREIPAAEIARTLAAICEHRPAPAPSPA